MTEEEEKMAQDPELAKPAPHSDLGALFERDPLKLTTEDVTHIVLDLQKRRVNYKFNNNKSAGNLTKREPKVAMKMSLTDLGL